MNLRDELNHEAILSLLAKIEAEAGATPHADGSGAGFYTDAATIDELFRELVGRPAALHGRDK